MRKYSAIILISILFILLLSGCKKEVENRISIAEQYGLAYAPLQIMKAKGFLEKNLPGIEVNWEQLGNTAAIREAMLAGKLDIGFMAIPPFLIAWDKGMKWKIISGLSISPLGLVTYRDDIKSIRDFSPEDRIALPQPGSIQHILLSMACEREFSNPRKLDDLLVTMAHPDGMNALLSRKEITAHFTSPPYIFKELKDGKMHQILSGKEAMGKEFTFIVGAATEKFYDNNPRVYKAFVSSLREAIDFINDHPEEAAAILATEYNLPEEEVLKYITWPGMKYTPVIKGLDEFAHFLKKNNYISKIYASREEVIWEDVKDEK
ncbi:MAG: sulfonate transport system substrate-binding protein [Halanaerobiales bacterium]|nr:sulfonate transport system substrate-binding protein [Halanaerobiales bacterium]